MPAALALDFATPALLLQTPSSGFRRWSSLFALPGLMGRLAQQGNQPVEGILTILLLDAVLPGLDDQHTLGGHTAASQAHQPLAYIFWKRRGIGHIETQLNCRCDLIYVLASWA